MNFLKKSKKIELNPEQYGKLLFHIIGIGEENFFTNCNFLDDSIISLELYYIFHLYICKCILQKKYSGEIVNIIIDSAQSSIISYHTEKISDIDKLSFSTKLNELYSSVFSSLQETNPAIEKNKQDFIELSRTFLDYLNNYIWDATKLFAISLEFSTFYTYHFSDILNKNIKII